MRVTDTLVARRRAAVSFPPRRFRHVDRFFPFFLCSIKKRRGTHVTCANDFAVRFELLSALARCSSKLKRERRSDSFFFCPRFASLSRRLQRFKTISLYYSKLLSFFSICAAAPLIAANKTAHLAPSYFLIGESPVNASTLKSQGESNICLRI